MSGWANDFRRQLQTPHSELGFILQVGYFKAAGHFFNPKHYSDADSEYIQKWWQLDTSELGRYEWATIGRHRNVILVNFGVKPFDQGQRTKLLVQTTLYARCQMNPVAVFRSTADYVRLSPY